MNVIIILVGLGVGEWLWKCAQTNPSVLRRLVCQCWWVALGIYIVVKALTTTVYH